jgi:hypothetical protein
MFQYCQEKKKKRQREREKDGKASGMNCARPEMRCHCVLSERQILLLHMTYLGKLEKRPSFLKAFFIGK